MIALRKQKQSPINSEAALTLRTADGAPLYTFPSDIITSMRHLETTLLYKGSLPSRIAMVAALREEGVTYTTLALATTLAYDLAVRVCVVELNWWSPGIRTRAVPGGEAVADSTANTSPDSRLKIPGPAELAVTNGAANGVSAAPSDGTILPSGTTGLAAVLMETTTLDKVLVQTALPNLALLPAGDLSPAQRPAMARGDMLKVCIEQLGRRFDHILLDIPAILATSDAIALASLAGACCVVIRQGVTPMSNVRRALDDVKHLPVLGVVLNQAHTVLPRWVRALVPQE